MKEEKVEHLTTFAKVKIGRYLVDEGDRQILEVMMETDKDISSDLIDVGSSFSVYP